MQGDHMPVPANLPERERSDARDAAGKAVGVSGKSVDHATKVLTGGRLILYATRREPLTTVRFLYPQNSSREHPPVSILYNFPNRGPRGGSSYRKRRYWYRGSGRIYDRQARERQLRKPADSVVENLPEQNRARDAATRSKGDPHMVKTCTNCGRTFDGRPNREYCGDRCRRRLEKRRAEWDRRARAVAPGGTFDRNTNLPSRTERQRAHWQSLWDRAREELGGRP